jgi:hypothetical protein
MQNLKRPRPAGWEKPQLTGYLESLWSNSVATFANKRESRRLCHIDDAMFEVAKDWKGGSPTAESIVPLMMYFRAHSAFRSAAALGMGGATVEGMAVLRLALEFSGYAALLRQETRLAKIWWDRDLTEEAEKQVRRAFQHRPIVVAIEARNPTLAKVYDELYDRTIQFGGHPNEKSITSNLKLNFQES